VLNHSAIMKKIFCFLFAPILFAQTLSAQFQNILVAKSNLWNEVSIAFNPKNTNKIVIGANSNYAFCTSNKGHTWQTKTLVDATNGDAGDPCLFTDTAGNFEYVHLSNPAVGSSLDRIVCNQSADGGLTWSHGTYTGLNGKKLQDKSWGTVNPFTNEIYVTWTQFDKYGVDTRGDSTIIRFSKSTDGGNTWNTPIRLSATAGNCMDGDSTDEGAMTAVGPNGELYVAWAGPDGIVFNKSLDDGNTWLTHETVVTTLPGGWSYNITGLQRCNGLPVTLCDLSKGPNRGTIYINWSDQRNGTTDTDIWLIKSSDGGKTWSSITRVNNDPPGKQQFMTWMCVDQANGNLYCDFYDRRNYPVSSSQTDLYMARSTDGGNTFENYEVTDSSFTPNTGAFLGDYIGIIAFNDTVRPAWMAINGNSLSIWTALIDNNIPLGIDKVNSGSGNSPIQLLQNSPNPFYQTTNIKFKLGKTENVDLAVYDLLGKKVATLYENEVFSEGEHSYVFNATQYNLKQGVYYYSLNCNEYHHTCKMIVY